MIYFVTENYLKTKTPITQNVAANDVMVFVEPSACAWMQSILGTYFFNHLLDAYNNQTLNADEQLLVAKIQPAVAWRAASDCVLGLTYQLKNKGLQKQNGDNSEAVELNETQFVMRHYEQKAEWFEAMVRKFILLNKVDYPQFNSKLNRDSEIAPQKDDNFNQDMLFI
jgi:hypothetical protein